MHNIPSVRMWMQFSVVVYKAFILITLDVTPFLLLGILINLTLRSGSGSGSP